MNLKIFDIYKNYIYINTMSCSSCKNKGGIKEDIRDNVKTTQTVVIVAIVVWFLLGCYGVYALISKLI